MQVDKQQLLDQDILSSYPYFGKVLGIISVSMFINRFIFYGFRSFLVLYMTGEGSGLGLPSQEAFDYYSLYSTGLYVAFMVMGILVLGIQRSALSALVGQFLAIGGYAGFLLVPEIPISLLISLIVAGEGLYRIGLYVTAVHNFLAGGKSGITTVTLMYLVINAAAFLASLLFPLLVDTRGMAFTMIPIFILGIINLFLLWRIIPCLKEAFIFIPKTIPGPSFPLRIAITAGLIVVVTLFWFIYEGIDVYLIKEKLTDLSQVNLLGFTVKKYWINTLPGLIPIFSCLVLLLLNTYNGIKNLTYHLGIGLITAASGFLLIIGFHQFYEFAEQDFSLYLISQLLVGISEILLTIVVMVVIGRWYKPWLLALVYGVYMGVVSFGSKARTLLFGNESQDTYLFVVFVAAVCLLMLIGGMSMLIKRGAVFKLSQR